MIAESEENIEIILQNINYTLKQECNMKTNKTKIKLLVYSR